MDNFSGVSMTTFYICRARLTSAEISQLVKGRYRGVWESGNVRADCRQVSDYLGVGPRCRDELSIRLGERAKISSKTGPDDME